MVETCLSHYLHLSEGNMHLRIVHLPIIDRNTKPISLFNRSVHFSNNLMNIMVPSSLTGAFVCHAQFNTMRNIETCAVLAGRNMSSLLTLRKLA